MKKGFLLVSGLGLGAGLMYVLDAQQGRRRRSRLRTNVRSARYHVSGLLEDAASGVRHRAQSAYVGTRARLPSSRWLEALPSRRRVRQRSVDPGLLLLGGLGLGVGLLTLIGAQKMSRDQTAAAAQRTMQNVYDWVCGVLHQGGAWLRQEDVSDESLSARVRARINRLVSRPDAIQVTTHQGRVTLSGSVLDRERDTLLSSIASMRGVTDVVNHLDVQERTTTIMGVQDRPVR